MRVILRGTLADRPLRPIAPDEVEAIKEFALRHPEDGLPVADVHDARPGHRGDERERGVSVLREADLLHRWKRVVEVARCLHLPAGGAQSAVAYGCPCAAAKQHRR